MVVDCNFEPISPIGSDNWPWVLLVDQHDHSFPSTIGIDRGVCDVQSVWNSLSGIRPLLVEVGSNRESIALDKLVDVGEDISSLIPSMHDCWQC